MHYGIAVELGDGGMLVVGASVSGILYSPVTSALSNVASHPASQSLSMEARELCVRPGIMWASRACSGNCGSDSWTACVVD